MEEGKKIPKMVGDRICEGVKRVIRGKETKGCIRQP